MMLVLHKRKLSFREIVICQLVRWRTYWPNTLVPGLHLSPYLPSPLDPWEDRCKQLFTMLGAHCLAQKELHSFGVTVGRLENHPEVKPTEKDRLQN